MLPLRNILEKLGCSLSYSQLPTAECVSFDILLDLKVQGFSKSHGLDFCFLATASTPKVFWYYVRSTDLNSRMSLGIYLSLTRSRRRTTGFQAHSFDEWYILTQNS